MAADGVFQRVRRRLRLARLNRMPGVAVDASAFIAATAMIQTDSDGCSFGGRVVIGPGVTLSDGVVVATYGGSITIDAHAYVGPYCVLYGHGGLVVGRNTMIGAHSVVVPANHGYARIDVPMNAQPLTREGITIGEDVWIGSGCRILDGVAIAQGAVIGAGSVVTKDIEAYAIAYGVPAVVVRSRRGDLRSGAAGDATKAS
jgi:acetyltransferase-like isoleucine patch superfamily enzyme